MYNLLQLNLIMTLIWINLKNLECIIIQGFNAYKKIYDKEIIVTKTLFNGLI